MLRCVALMLLISVVAVQAQPVLPPPAQPTIVVGKLVKDEFIYVTVKPTAITMTQTVLEKNQAGKTITKTVPIAILQNQTVTEKLKISEIEITNALGKKVLLEQIEEQLRKDTPVVLSPPGQDIAPVYRKMFKDDTICFLLPPPSKLKDPIKMSSKGERPINKE